jgi:hypothetical protein
MVAQEEQDVRVKLFEAVTTLLEPSVAVRSRTLVTGKTWFDARAIAGVVLGAAPERIKMWLLEEYSGIAFHRPPIQCASNKFSEIGVYDVEQKKGQSCRVLGISGGGATTRSPARASSAGPSAPGASKRKAKRS